MGPPERGATLGNRYDPPLLSSLLEDLEVEYALADAGYDFKTNWMGMKAIGAEPVIAVNQRRGLKRKTERKQLLKNHVLKGR